MCHVILLALRVLTALLNPPRVLRYILVHSVSIAGVSIPVSHNRSHGDVSRFSPLGDAQMRTGASTDRCVVEDEWSLGNAASRRRVEGDVKVLPLPMLYRPERGHRFQFYTPVL